MNSFNPHPHFYFKKHAFYDVCIQHQLKNSEKEKLYFGWSVCDINQKEQRWVNVGSKNIPGSIQICQAGGEKKCLMDSSGIISLADYRSSVDDSPAQLWKMNSRGQLMNVYSGSCLHGFKHQNMEVVKLSLTTTKCGGLRVSYDTEWFFLPVFSPTGLRIYSSDFQTPEKNSVGNNQKFKSKFSDTCFPYNRLRCLISLRVLFFTRSEHDFTAEYREIEHPQHFYLHN